MLIQLSADGHLGDFHFGAVVNKAAMSSRVQVAAWTCIFTSPGYIPRDGIARSCGDFVYHLKSRQKPSQNDCTTLSVQQ